MRRECARDVKLLGSSRFEELLSVPGEQERPAAEHVPVPNQAARLGCKNRSGDQREGPGEQDDDGGHVKVEQDVERVAESREEHHQAEDDGQQLYPRWV